MTTFTFKDMAAIKTALIIAAKTDLPIDTASITKVLLKIDDATYNYCIPLRYIEFAFLPMLAKSHEE